MTPECRLTLQVRISLILNKYSVHGTEITVRFENVSPELKCENLNYQRTPEFSLIPRCPLAWLTISAADKCNIVSYELLSAVLLNVRPFYSFPLQGRSISSPFMDCLTLNKEALLSSELSVIIYRSSRCNTSESLDLQVQYQRKHAWTNSVIHWIVGIGDRVVPVYIKVLVQSLITWTLDDI